MINTQRVKMEGKKYSRRSSLRRGKQDTPVPMRKSRSLSQLSSRNRSRATCSTPLMGVRVLIPKTVDASYAAWLKDFEDPAREFKLRGFRRQHEDLISGQMVRSGSLDSFVLVEGIRQDEVYDPFRGSAGRLRVWPAISQTMQRINFETRRLLKKCWYREKIVEGERVKLPTYISYDISVYSEDYKKGYSEEYDKDLDW